MVGRGSGPVGRVVIIHGWNNRPDDGWLGWLRRELEAKGLEVVAPPLPRRHTPRPAEWLKAVEEAAGKLDNRTVIVAYSLGVPTILRYLENHPKAPRLAGLVMIAGFGSGFGGRPAALLSPVFDFGRLRAMARRRTCIYSTNDRIVPPRYSRALAEALDAQQIVHKGAGHFIAWKGVPRAHATLETALEAVLGCYPQGRRERFELWFRDLRGRLMPRKLTRSVQPATPPSE